MTTDPTMPRPLLYPATPIADMPPAGRPGSVAVVMRTRDRPQLLTRALDSVCAQTWRDWHLYLVNDGGAAAPVDAALAAREDRLAGRVTSIRLAEPVGIARAANAAFARAREEFVAVHDDDDSWEPGFLEAAAGFLAAPEHRGFVGVTTGCTLIEERLTPDGPQEVRRHVWPHHRGTVDLRRALVDTQIPPIAMLFRRAALDAIGPLNGALTYVSDLEFNYRLLLLGEIGFVDRPLAAYHHRVPGTTGAAANSIAAGAGRVDQHLRLRNGLLRASLADRPEAIGALQAVLQATDESRRHLEERMACLEHRLEAALAATDGSRRHMEERTARLDQRLEATLAALERRPAGEGSAAHAMQQAIEEIRVVAAWQRKMLRPVRWVWLRALPLRRAIARARGRVAEPPAA